MSASAESPSIKVDRARGDVYVDAHGHDTVHRSLIAEAMARDAAAAPATQTQPSKTRVLIFDQTDGLTRIDVSAGPSRSNTEPAGAAWKDTKASIDPYCAAELDRATICCRLMPGHSAYYVIAGAYWARVTAMLDDQADTFAAIRAAKATWDETERKMLHHRAVGDFSSMEWSTEERKRMGLAAGVLVPDQIVWATSPRQ